MNLSSIKELLNSVSNWLKLFALVIIIAETVILAAMKMTPNTHWIFPYYPLLILLFLLFVPVMFVYEKSFSTPKPSESKLIETDEISIEYETTIEVNNLVNKIRKNIAKGLSYKSNPLEKIILEELRSLNVESKEWSRGIIHTDESQYKEILLQLYEEAENSIFSTTVPEYINEWSDQLIEQMINASDRSKADNISRVFLFESKRDIDSECLRVLEKFSDLKKVKGYIYINEDDESFHWNPDIVKDFVVIDNGKAIGITTRIKDGFQAKWFISDPDRMATFNNTIEGLKKCSIRLIDFLNEFKQHSN